MYTWGIKAASLYCLMFQELIGIEKDYREEK